MKERSQFGIAMFGCGMVLMFFVVSILNDFNFFCR